MIGEFVGEAEERGAVEGANVGEVEKFVGEEEGEAVGGAEGGVVGDSDFR